MTAKSYIAIGALISLLLPLLIYCMKFGLVISTDHQRWAEFGSALSGIYSPILGALTLIVLFEQLDLQAVITRHQLDQAYIASAKAECESATKAISVSLNQEVIPGKTRRDLLHESFLKVSRSELLESPRYDLALGLLFDEPGLYMLWLRISSALTGLSANASVPYRLGSNSVMLGLVSEVSYFSCVAIENACFAMTRGSRPNHEFFFSAVGRVPMYGDVAT